MLLYSQVKNFISMHFTNHSSYGPIFIDACMYHIDLSLKCNVLLITTQDTMIPYYTDPPPVSIIIGATVGAIGVVLIIIITLVSIVLIRRKRGKS